MKLAALLNQVPVVLIKGTSDREITDVHFDSRSVKGETMFVAVKGTATDGHAFIDIAIAKGATAVVCEEFPATLVPEITYVKVENSQRELAYILSNLYGNPSRKLIVVGVTGTNGKTTSVNLLHRLFQHLGYTSGMISTIGNKIGDRELPATHTTPDPRQLHQLFAEMVKEGCEYCFMEVSSHSLVQHRVSGIPFRLAMFTNITHDHLDYHGSFSEYIRAKKILFDQLAAGSIALINTDDKNSKVMVQNTRATVRSFAISRAADYHAKIVENTFQGLLLRIENEDVWFRMIGSFNAYNLLMVLGAAVELGLNRREALEYLSGFEGVSGRFQVIRSKKAAITGIVDYAHTPDALENVLNTIQNIHQAGGKVITVVGCGGNRDKGKRPVMGRIAAEKSDQVIFTSDNPRNEEPQTILEEISNGVSASQKKKTLVIENRKEAIRTASRLATELDIILVAGKGHEDYQEIQGVKHPFDDRIVLQEALDEFHG
ncbi:MAG: UDP-N-acetylmuramoyl-L-alanyl-D-glutamate--2,6-diaminopimelate ligase [Bacteroidia bacterium]|nr:UDP-N-acetylmuramoyl-L-alanyl-D-glutamate--2,6-diaminopimelate ligase [Bacteroidia bacterium]